MLKYILKLAFSGVLVLIVIYVLMCGFLYYKQNDMIYYTGNKHFEDCEYIKSDEKIKYKNTRFYFHENSKNLLVYYHGNAGTACGSKYFWTIANEYDYSYLIAEYTGYAGSNKTPGIDLLLENARNIESFISSKDFEKVVIIGQSLGASVASYHSTLREGEKLVLISPFDSTLEIAKKAYPIFPVKFLLKDKYDNIEWSSGYEDVVIIHGEKDIEVVPEHSRKLFDATKTDNKKYVLIPNAGHNNIIYHDRVKREIVNAFK